VLLEVVCRVVDEALRERRVLLVVLQRPFAQNKAPWPPRQNT
jgi:hypothetical protein